MDQSTLKEFVRIIWGAMFVYLGIIAAVCLFLLLRLRAVRRPFRFREEKEIEEKAPWRKRIRDALLIWRPRRK
jgi:hypothetical protein